MDREPLSSTNLTAILDAAQRLASPEEQRSFLEQACHGDTVLARSLQETLTWNPAMGSPGTPPASAGDLPIGQVVSGRFHILRKLGEGGMAVVYEAVDGKLIERRALKFAKAGHFDRLSPEARSALRITHDNICRIHEIHTAETGEGTADFISMEFLEGETLFDRWRKGPIPQTEFLDIARQLCRGLEAAHQAGILHRDLKSNNVMLTRRAGGGVRVVITDFGLARPAQLPGVPATSALSGTPNYIAPERWQGAPASPASDVYALGVMLYESLTGTLPFPRNAPVAERIATRVKPPSTTSRAPDKRWDPIVARCLDPNPQLRFVSAGAVLNAIERAFGSRRRRWIAAAAAVIFAATGVAALRDFIFPPPPLARLAILPLTGPSLGAATDAAVLGGLHDVANRLESLGAASRRLVVIPLESSLRYQVNSPPLAASRLGASHALTGTLNARGERLEVRVSIQEISSGASIRRFEGEFLPTDLASLSASLAGVVTSAFRLPSAPPVSIRPEAYPAYAAGLASLRRDVAPTDAAMESLNAALRLDPRSPLILAGLAEAQYKKFFLSKDPASLQSAASLAREAESLQPDLAPVLLVLGAIEVAQGETGRALERYRRAAEIEPGNSDVWVRTGIALGNAGRNPEAMAAFQKAIQLAPDYFAPHFSFAAFCFRSGLHAQAAEEYRKVIRLAPDFPDGHSSLGGALVALGQHEKEAEQHLRRSLELRESRGALNNLGVLLRYQRRDQEAVPVLERALKAGVDDPGLRLNLANALRSAGRPEDARPHIERAAEMSRAALRQNPRDAAARARLSFCMVHLGMRALAPDEAFQAARLAPANYSVLYWIVMTFESLGRPKDALPLLAAATAEQLKDLQRQPDLAAFSRDRGFQALLQQSDAPQAQKRGQHGSGN
jgi:tetratricopeptide (TPR) repeat protein